LEGAAVTVRWRFVEVETGEQYTVPINPDSMSSPFHDRQFTTSFGSRAGGNRLRTIERPAPPKEWEFGGVIRTKAHHDALDVWAKKPGLINVYDHLGRAFQVVFTAFEPVDRQPTPQTPWRMRYVMNALVLRRLA
jgi:hypothetical protein